MKFNIPFCPEAIVCVFGVIVSVPVTRAGVGVVVVVVVCEVARVPVHVAERVVPEESFTLTIASFVPEEL